MSRAASALTGGKIFMFLNAKKYFYVMLVLCVILLALPIAIRHFFNNGFMVGEDSYTTLRTAQYIHIITSFLPRMITVMAADLILASMECLYC